MTSSANAHAGLQRPLSQRHGTSLDEWHGRCAVDLRTDCLVRDPAGIGHRRSRAVHHPPDARNTRCNSSSEQSGPASSKMKRHRHSNPYSNGTRRPVSSLISISIDLKCEYNRGT